MPDQVKMKICLISHSSPQRHACPEQLAACLLPRLAADCLEGIVEFPYAATYLQQLADKSERNLPAQPSLAFSSQVRRALAKKAVVAGWLTRRLSAPGC